MTVFRGMGKIKDVLDKAKQRWSAIRTHSLTGKLGVKPVGKEQVKASALSLKMKVLTHKWTLLKSVSALSLVAASVWSGNQYVQAQMTDYYHVLVNGTPIGIVSDPQKVETFKEEKKKQLAQSRTDVQMAVESPDITFTRERAFKPRTEEQEVLGKLEGFFTAYPVGVEVLVDGKRMGILKDQETAQKMLEQIKATALDSLQKKKEPGKVGILSASSASSAPVESELLKAEFKQQVELQEIPIEPSELVQPDELRKKLETGDVQPTKYTVEQGDCLGCIAKKFNIPKQVIYQNNPSITGDFIKAGQQLDLTVLQPTLAVRTVEKVVENQEIQYETEYQTDDSLRLGTIQTITPGKNGLKKVTIQLTKVNGLLEEEEVLSEEIIDQPVKAVAKKGTKVVKGEGTGKFAWPVVGSSISSTFGTRWGALHKGIDLTGNRNILASDNGKVIFAGVKDGYGNAIILDHMNGYKTLYGHLSQISVTNGKIVEKGEKIGIMGSTGNSTGVHLHFEIQRNNTPENPLKYLNR
ncbi:M23 family metallopeptidase [Paenibacillus sp. GD4]|uniref:M23 family metallopeptidase n=1 Tax=Paenibacillus sp. GD4 TaxID=3068890 RepID=UPI002796A2F6|nr:M23 family metallopeptidase [Paenibacillus sp. GD4]MDQ1911154.1 M23 family metallopeptidase [Paenibacillus sp. GD4]